MKFILTVRHLSGGDPWEEPYDKPELRTQYAVEKWALYIVEWFNGTRRKGERARQLVSVKILSESCEKCRDRKAIWFRQPRQNR
jgi:hypothetical protein